MITTRIAPTHSIRPRRLRPTLPALLALLASTALAAACSDGSGAAEEDPGEDLTAPTDATGQPVEIRPIDPATTGSVRGVVRFEGDPPERKEIGTGGIPACEVHDGPLLTETVLVQDGRLANVFVHVKKGLAGWEIPPAPAGEHVIDQVGCVYVPHVSVMRAGQVLRVKNSDPETHNVNLKAPRNGNSANITQGPGSPDKLIEFERREHKIELRCDLHPWMRAYLHVSDHPFHDLTGADGAFEITGLPPGEYTLEALHEEYRPEKATVVVAAGETAEAEFVFTD